MNIEERRKRRWRERGAVLLETAVVLPLVLLLIFGIVQVGIVTMNWQVANYAAFEAARDGAVRLDYLENPQTVITADQWGTSKTEATVGGVNDTTDNIMTGEDDDRHAHL